MIGTGVFTSLGFQLLDIESAPVILLLWFLGGCLALCGALCYAELGAALPRSGGEYNYMSRIYHPSVGFVSGWISTTIGFAAPTALAAITAGRYLGAAVPDIPETLVAVALVVSVAMFHVRSRQASARFQEVFTFIKVLLIMAMIVAIGFVLETPQDIRWVPIEDDTRYLMSGGFAVSLIFVNYAYTGWNAATYVAGEIETPSKVLPRVLIIGTGFVALLYMALHVAFLAAAPMDQMAGKLEVGFIVAEVVFGEAAGRLIGILLAFLLISTVSAMILAGPRALQMIGQDFRLLRFMARENRHGVPSTAIISQTAITVFLVVTSTFEAVLVFAGSVLALNTLFVVVGVAVLRVREPELPRPFTVPLFPFPLLVFAGITLWTLTYLVFERPMEMGFGLVVIASGWLFYWLGKRFDDRRVQSSHP